MSGLLSRYGIFIVLLLLIIAFSAGTWREQSTEGEAAARELADRIAAEAIPATRVFVAAGPGRKDAAFAETLVESLRQSGVTVVGSTAGHPYEVREELTKLAASNQSPTVIATSRAARKWLFFDSANDVIPGIDAPAIVSLGPYRWSTFLTTTNLLNVANQTAINAILAAGMTLVILTGGIDLSVGSLIALGAVLSTLLIQDRAGGTAASPLGMFLCSLAGIAACGLVGLANGIAVARFRVPAFIVTLGSMLIASGAAYLLSDGQSVNGVPDSFVRLGRGADILGIPNAVVLMLAIYGIVGFALMLTAFGRYVYAVGGNAEAARLSGVRVSRVLVSVYIVNGLLAGLGGVVMASALKSGSPNYGQMYELYVIAAVVVGGTSLRGGHGGVLGTLIGAFVIAVIQNGMNLVGVESYTQKVVLGAIILAAVLLDRKNAAGQGTG